MPDGLARKASSTFRMECAVATTIAAPPARVWALLTDAEGFPRWNTTVTSIEGAMALGQRLRLKVPNSDRTFTPTVTTLDPEKRMVWSEGMAPMFRGERTFTLAPAEGGTRFEMVEVLRGLMLPLIQRTLPDFAPPFEQYARDLKAEAERTAG